MIQFIELVSKNAIIEHDFIEFHVETFELIVTNVKKSLKIIKNESKIIRKH